MFEHRSLRAETESSVDKQNLDLHATKSGSEAELPMQSDQDSSRYARSTLAQALAPPKIRLINYSSDESDLESSARAPREAPRRAQFSISSREVTRKCFDETNPIRLPQCHPTIAFNQEQMCQILKVVAYETARSSFDIMNDLIGKASQLNLGQARTRTEKMHRPRSVQSTCTDSATDLRTYRDGTPSGRSDLWDTDCFMEQTPSRASVVNIPSPPVPGCSQGDLRSPISTTAVNNPGAQTLAELKREASLSKNKKSSKRPKKAKSKTSKKAVWRSNIVMREELFEDANFCLRTDGS